MSEQVRPWAKERLEKLNKTLETLGMDKLKLVEVSGVRFGLASNVSKSVLSNLAKLFHEKPHGANNCFAVAKFVKDRTGAFDTIQTKSADKIVGGNHGINFGQGLLVDISFAANYSFDGMFDALVFQLPNNYDTNTDSYLALASLVYGGKWEYKEKKGLGKFDPIKAALKRVMGL